MIGPKRALVGIDRYQPVARVLAIVVHHQLFLGHERIQKIAPILLDALQDGRFALAIELHGALDG